MTCPHCQNDDRSMLEHIGGGPLHTLDEACEILDDLRNDGVTEVPEHEDNILGPPLILCGVCSRIFEKA